MSKTRKLTFLRIEQILTFLVFAFMIYCQREFIINSFERQIEMRSIKIVSTEKDKLKKQHEDFFVKKMEHDFSTHVNLLIIVMIWGTLMLMNLQRRINKEKSKNLAEG